MKLDSLTLPGAKITNVAPTKKLTVYEYPYSDVNEVVETGLGVAAVTVEGLVTVTATRDAIDEQSRSAGVKKLYFNSAVGDAYLDDRYYKVQTHPAVFTPSTATAYHYSIECVCADPKPYVAATDTAVF